MLDTTTFNNNSTTIATDAAAIGTAYAANIAALAAERQEMTGSALELAGQLADQYALDVARTLIAAGLRDIFILVRNLGLDHLPAEAVTGAGTTGLEAVYAARITAGQLGDHT